VLIEVLADKNVPIFYGFDSCHTHPMLVTPLGVRGTIDFDNHTFKLEDRWVKAK
ncbi:LD-carboxypeptidase, partial [Vibrio cholerae]